MAIVRSPAPAATSATTAVASAAAAVVTNGIRLTAVAEKLASHFHGSLSLTTTELFQLCYALARGIDYALSSNDVPRVANSIPVLVKKAFQHRNDPALNSAMMVLMISAKNASRSGWFTLDDRDEIVSMANELSSSFCLSMGLNEDSVETLATLMKIMPRYFPQMNVCRVIASFRAKTGYDILMSDFFIQRNIATNEKIRLFVILTDDLESSSCIATPHLVSFLVNGKGVDKRNNVSMEIGPQLPTDITKMLKYGTNIIQAAGYFPGNYLIAIAFTSKLDMTSPPILQDYVELATDELDSDSDIIMDSSTVSMNCPISFGRIKTPVKGHQCRHNQCFDYDNYMEINSRKPVWRCPCCNSTVCCLDVRLDQRMVQILKEVDENTTSVTISSDGSWKRNEEQNKNQQTVNTHDKNQGNDAAMDDVTADVVNDVIDLTGVENNANDLIQIEEEEDTKPFLDCEEFLSVPHFNTPAPPTQATIFHAAEDNAWLRSTFSPGSGTLDSLIPDSILNPLTTGTINNIINNNASIYINNNNNNSTSSISTPGGQIGSSSRPPIPRNVTRMPNVVQALPVPSANPSPNPSPSSRRNFANGDPSSFAASQFSTGTRDGIGGSFSSGSHLGSLNTNAPPSFMTALTQGMPSPSRSYQHTMGAPTQRPPHLRNTHSSPLNPNSSPLNPNSSGARIPPVHITISSARRTHAQSQSPLEAVRPELLPPEQGWRPAGRMRGSLTGEAYSSALSHYLVPPPNTQSPSPGSNASAGSSRGGPNWS